MSIKSVIDDLLQAQTAERCALATLHVELGYASGLELADAIIAVGG